MFLAGQDVQEANAGAPKGGVKPWQMAGSFRWPLRISGRIPVLVAGPARALTWTGEPAEMASCRGWSRRAG
jgi:hypothetical protein